MKREKKELVITPLFNEGKKACKEGNFNIARYNLNLCIAKLAQMTIDGILDTEKYSVDFWKDRCWLLLEKYDLLDCGDCSDLNL